MPIVYGSRHGEAVTTERILKSLTAMEDVSPTDFMLSVHNTAGGICSIAHQNHAPNSALAAGRYSCAATVVEALGMVAEENQFPAVAAVCTDDVLPEIFPCPGTREPLHGVAVLFSGTATPHAAQVSFELQPEPSGEPQLDEEGQSWALIRWLLGATPELRLSLGGTCLIGRAHPDSLRKSFA